MFVPPPINDPVAEAQVVLPQLTSDFYQLIMDLLNGNQPVAEWQDSDVYVGVVLAAAGYPQAPIKGAKVPTVDEITPLIINFAGVKAGVASGGRVATVVAHDMNTTLAQQKVYNKLDQLGTDLQYRHDIAYQAIQHEVK